MASVHAPSPSRAPGKGDHVILVDGSSFIFRAYFQSIRQDQRYNFRSDRLPTGAVRIFATKLLQFVRDGARGRRATHLAMIFDKSEDSFRKALYPAYKANRSDPPEDLVPQFPLMRAVVRAFLDALTTEKVLMFYILFFIVIVAAFGNMSALITFVVQKTREIGVLKALGARPSSIALLFVGQSAVVGILGVAAGFILGMVALHYRNEFLYFMNNRLGMDLFPASIYQFAGLPARIVPGDVAVICGGSLLICLLAGVIPALRAAWLQPVQALRNE